jgi:hypothetical protein
MLSEGKPNTSAIGFEFFIIFPKRIQQWKYILFQMAFFDKKAPEMKFFRGFRIFLGSYSFNCNLFAIRIRFLQTCRRILPHDSVSLSLAQGALPQRLGNARTSSRATLASGGSHP